MAESKSSLLAKSVQKHAGRAKEKILQNLGKVDRTADEIFDEHLTNFNRQNVSANKLQKEFNNYIRCVRAVQLASKTLMDAVSEVYEPHWNGYDDLVTQAANTESIWQEFSHKLGDQVLIPLNTYSAQFPEMKKKIEKRNRKLIDYDSQRHSFQNVQANASKRKDDVKITKGREQLEEARRTYEILNTELHDELPALYDSRILFLVTNLQTLFASEQVFHHESSKIFSELESIVDKLATDSQKGSYTIKKATAQTPIKAINHTNENSSYENNPITNGSSNANNSPQSSTSSPVELQNEPEFPKVEPKTSSTEQTTNSVEEEEDEITTTPTLEAAASNKSSQPGENKTNDNNEPSYENTTTTTTTTAVVGSSAASADQVPSSDTLESPNANSKKSEDVDEVKTDKNVTNATNGNVEMKPDAKNNNTDITTGDLPPGVLYRVKATYSYEKEDVDELNFEIGEIIRVIEYDDPEDQEEGWLMGQKEGTTEKGLFPANFTRPI